MNKEHILDKNTMIVSETDSKGIIIYANEDFCKISGYSKDELIGNPHNMVRHKDMPKAAFEDLWNYMKEDKLWTGIVKNRCKNGDYYWVNASVYSVKKTNGSKRLISVRVKPTQDEVTKAISLYKSLD